MSLFFTKRFYIAAWLIVLLFVAAYIYSPLFVLAKIVFGLAWIAVGYDIWQMYRRNGEMSGRRECAERFSNGDENQVLISFCNPYPFRVGVEVIDEAPVQFQLRDLMLTCRLAAAEEKTLGYTVVPKSDPRFWFTDEIVYVEAAFRPTNAGDYKLYLNLPDPKPNLRNNPRYSIRLANENCWDETTGYNYLTTITIE